MASADFCVCDCVFAVGAKCDRRLCDSENACKIPGADGHASLDLRGAVNVNKVALSALAIARSETSDSASCI